LDTGVSSGLEDFFEEDASTGCAEMLFSAVAGADDTLELDGSLLREDPFMKRVASMTSLLVGGAGGTYCHDGLFSDVITENIGAIISVGSLL
jgi:hypothetical protein